MRLIDANKLYKSLDDKHCPHERLVKIEDILEIIKNQPTVNAIKISPNLTNKGFIKKSFPNIEFDDEECNGIIYGYEKSDFINSIVPLMAFKPNWLKKKYGK